MKRRNSHRHDDAVRNRDKYDHQTGDFRGQSSVMGALVETFLNPFFVLGRR